jgi:hypothetical protein
MKQRTCIALCSLHLLALAVCTYIAAIEIETILVTGWICSATGLAMGISAIACKKPVLAAAGFLTPIIAVVLFVLETAFLHLGPRNAALPFCIVFIVNQVLATVVILVQLRMFTAPPGTRATQIALKTLMVSMVSFSVFFAIARRLLEREHDWLMALALGLLGLASVGLSVVLYSAIVDRSKAQIAA